jgi:hypothetical protein
MNAVVEAGPSASSDRRVLLCDELGVHQLRKMLSDGVVIEPEVLGQLRNVDR